MLSTVRRGMIFWFTPFPETLGENGSKYDPTAASPGGAINDSKLLTGRRPCLVISNDIVNKSGYVCTIVPFRTNNVKNVRFGTSVDTGRKHSYVDARFITTINQCELSTADFIGILDDSSMKRVDSIVMNYLSTPNDNTNKTTPIDAPKYRYTEPTPTKNVNNPVVQVQVVETVEPKVVEPAVVQSPVKRSPSKKNTPKSTGATKSSAKRPRTMWDKEKLEKFILDDWNLTRDEFYDRYNIRSSKNFYATTKSYVARKYSDLTGIPHIIYHGHIIPEMTNDQKISFMVDSDTMTDQDLANKYNLSANIISNVKEYVYQ